MVIPTWLWLLALAMVLGGIMHGRSRRYQSDMRRTPTGCVLVLVGAALVVVLTLVNGQLAPLLAHFF